MQKVIGKYQNGNYSVTMLSDGTKIRRTEEDDFIPAFSENTDVTITRKCSMNCQFCLDEDTIIDTEEFGEITIKEATDIFDKGTEFKVTSFNIENKSFEYAKVTNAFLTKKNAKVITLLFNNGTELTCTPDHKIFTLNRGYIEAEFLDANDVFLFDTTFDTVGLNAIVAHENVDVYDLTVKDNHNFFANHILVHNCYDGDTPDGKHGNLNYEFLKHLHPYTEMAINGNDMNHPDLIPFLESLKEQKVFANVTLNQVQFERNIDLVRELINKQLIWGLGISLVNANKEFVEKVKEFPNAVIHTINGLLSEEQINILANNGLKILVLGYKIRERGDSFYQQHKELVEERKAWLNEHIDEVSKRFKVLSFDNLAIEQMPKIREVVGEQWDEFYMGDDGKFTFYIDVVEGVFAKNSCIEERFPIGDKTIDEMFQFIQEKYNN